MKFAELLKYYRERKNHTKTSLAAKTGISATYIKLMENGERIPSSEKCEHLAEALFLSKDQKKEFLETAFIEKHQSKDAGYFKALGPKGMNQFMRDIPGSYPVEDVPLIEWSALPPPDTSKGGLMKYALKVQNNEMESEFVKGDIIHVERGGRAADGDFVIAKPPSGNPILRLFRKFGTQTVLLPLNREYPEIILRENPHDIMGIVVEKLKVYKRK